MGIKKIISNGLNHLKKKPHEKPLDNLAKLPIEIQQYILSFCDPHVLLRAQCTCSLWKGMIDDDYLWGLVAEKLYGVKPEISEGNTLKDVCLLCDPVWDISGEQKIPYTIFREILDFTITSMDDVDFSKVTVGRLKAELVKKHHECQKNSFNVASKIGQLVDDSPTLHELFPDGNIGSLAINILKPPGGIQ